MTLLTFNPHEIIPVLGQSCITKGTCWNRSKRKQTLFISASLHRIPTGSEVFGYIATLGSNFWIAFIKLTLAVLIVLTELVEQNQTFKPPCSHTFYVLPKQFLFGFRGREYCYASA